MSGERRFGLARSEGRWLARVGAKFVYVFDPDEREGRTWDNAGAVEDVATGSAAGPVAAYLMAHGLAAQNEALIVNLGRFLRRPAIAAAPDTRGELWVGGPVIPVVLGTADGPRTGQPAVVARTFGS